MLGLRPFAIAITVLIAIMATVSSCANQYPIFSSAARYEAHLRYADDPGRIPGYFMVKLHLNHKFEDHMARLGDIQYLVSHRFASFEEEVYNIHGVSDITLTAIRADPGVAEVICDRTWEFRE